MTSHGRGFLISDKMAAWLCCLRHCWNGTPFTTGQVAMRDLPAVKLDTLHMGHDVVIVKTGRRICGTGAALANAPIVQNKAYFEVKLQCSGTWGVGVATRKCDLGTVPLGTNTESWVIRQDGKLYHNGEVLGKLTEDLQEGDVIGFTYDHIDLRIYINGKIADVSFKGIRGTIYPVMYVDNGAVLDVQFSKFYHPPPDGFEEIMIEKSLL